MKRLVITSVFALCGCVRQLPPELLVQCEEDADCPGDLVCVAELETCLTPGAAAGRTCGDGIVARDGSEQCDDGAQNADLPGACRTSCTLGLCGDGIVDPDEECDDGNQDDEDPCLTTCEQNRCGDGVAELAGASEECDDGNAILNDHCLPGCALNVCGDGVVDELDEACDDGNDTDGDGCRNDCGVNVCGDGVLWAGVEVCDEGDTASGDGCRGDCRKLEVCGDRELDAGEECDDGNLNPVDGCDACADVIWRRRVVTGASSPAQPALDVPLPGLRCLEGAGPTSLLLQAGCLVYRFDTVARTLEQVAGASECGFAGDGGPATAALLDDPAGMAVDAQGRVYLADRGNHRVRRVELDGTINTIAGDGVAGFAGDGGPAASARLSSPSDVSLDPAGLILIADTGNNRVRVIDLDGRVRTLIGTGANANSGDGGLASAAAIAAPEFVHARPSGGVFVGADTVHLRLVGTNGADALVQALPSYFHSTGCLPTGAGDDVWTTSFGGHGSNFYSAFDVTGATVGSGQLPYGSWPAPLGYVDGDHVYLAHDGLLMTLSGALAAGSKGTTAVVPGTAATSFDLQVADLEPLDDGALVIADEVHQRLVFLDADGLVTLVIGGSEVAQSGEVVGPRGLARDTGSGLFYGDTINRIWRMASAGETPTLVETRPRIPNYVPYGTVGGMASVPGGGYVVTDKDLGTAGVYGTVHLAGDCFPDIVMRDDGIAVFSDSCTDTVRAAIAVDSAPYLAGTGTAGFNGDGVATTRQLNNPSALATDGSAIFISDAGNGRLRRLDPDGTLTTIAGPGTTTIMQGRRLGDVSFANVRRMAWVDGGLLVATASHVVRIRAPFDPDSRVEPVAGAFDDPGLGVGEAALLNGAIAAVPLDVDAVLVAQGRRVAFVDLATPAALPAAGILDGFGPLADPFVTGAVSARYAALANRLSAVTGNHGSFIYADEGDHSLWQLDASGARDQWTVGKLAGLGAGFADGALADARFDAPSGVALTDDATTLYVADATHHVIRKVDLVAEQVETIAGARGIAGFYGDGGHALDALFDTPRALAVHADGTLFVLDAGNRRVRSIAPDGTVSTVLGDGTASSTGEGAPARTFPIDDPRGLALDDVGNLYVTAHDVVRVVLAPDDGPPTGESAVHTIFGRAPRTDYPERVVRCLAAPAVLATGRVVVADACNGLVLELTLEDASP